MKKALTAALIAGSLIAATGAVAEEVTPLEVTQSSQLPAELGPILPAILFTIFTALAISSTDGT